MTDSRAERVSIDLTTEEAKLVIVALQRFEPFWPSDLEDLSRAELLAGIRDAIDHVTTQLRS